MAKKYISFIVILCLMILPVVMVFDASNAAIAPQLGVYLSEIRAQTDWTVMARKAIGQDVSDTSFLKNLDGETANDYATYILAITSLGEDPRSFGSENLVYGLRQKSKNGQIGDEAYLNDDIFGLIALRSAAVSLSDPLVAQEVDYIKSKQTQDGGWSWDAQASEGTVDYAAMGIMALLAVGVDITDSSVVSATNYLISAQNEDGGFGMSKTGASNTASTAWALSAINAMGSDVNFYKPAGLSPIDYLNARLHEGGYFLFDAQSSQADLFTPYTTSYAAIALSGKYYPISSISAPPQVSLRVEGKNSTVCVLDGAQGRSALDVIKSSDKECGYEYVIEQYDWGAYLTTISGEVAEGMAGWLFTVNNESLMVGSSEFKMTSGDNLLVHYGAWDDKPLRVRHEETSVELGSTSVGTVEKYSSGEWSAVSGAVLKRGFEQFTTDSNGQASLTWSRQGAFYLFAQAQGGIRSQKVLVIAGEAGVSQQLPMSVNIESGSSGGHEQNAGQNVDVIFGVSGDLNFGALKPGQSSTKKALIINSSNINISTTATVQGASLFVNNIKLDNVASAQWQKIVSRGLSSEVNVTLSVPTSYSGLGQEQGILIFWANPLN